MLPKIRLRNTMKTIMKKVECHNLKIDKKYYQEVSSGNKKFEIRFNDRNFKEGDFVVLHECDIERRVTGCTVQKRIGFVTDYEQKEGYVVFSLLGLV